MVDTMDRVLEAYAGGAGDEPLGGSFGVAGAERMMLEAM